MSEVDYLISRLQLEPLQPEGGYFKRTWTSPTVSSDDGPAGTAIYFLLTSTTYSAFHRLKADELWHFYSGDTVEHWQLRPGVEPIRRLLRGDLRPSDDAEPQVQVPANTWQAARLAPNPNGPSCGWALLGCTTNPGWRDGLFELAHRTQLARDFPQNLSIIAALTR